MKFQLRVRGANGPQLLLVPMSDTPFPTLDVGHRLILNQNRYFTVSGVYHYFAGNAQQPLWLTDVIVVPGNAFRSEGFDDPQGREPSDPLWMDPTPPEPTFPDDPPPPIVWPENPIPDPRPYDA